MTRIPRHHICIATTVRPDPSSLDDRVLDRVCIRVGQWHRGRWSEDGCSIHPDTASFTASMLTILEAVPRAWVWMLDPAQDMPALRFTQRVAEGQVTRSWWVWGDPPTIISGKWFGTPVTILGVANWLDVRRASAELDIPPARGAHNAINVCSPFDSPSYWQGARCAELVKRILSFVAREDLGHLRTTSGGQAMQSFRHLHLGGAKVLVDNHRSALALERSCAIGFPVRCHAQGRISESTYVVDVNSLYPWVMSQYRYPRKRTYYGRCDGLDGLRSAMARYAVMARVSGSDPERDYLVQRDGRCVYAHDLHDDTLCGPDLDSFVSRGRCRGVSVVSTYDWADLFGGWGRWAWSLRCRYRERKDKIGEMLAKSLSVSLWGKFAGTLGRWGPLPAGVRAPTDYGRWQLVDDHGALHECRSIAGIHEVLAEDEEPAISCPATSAYVACYARAYMRGLRAIAGDDEVRYQCADALHVTQLGRDRLDRAGLVRPDDFGSLKVAGPFTDALYHAPNIYRIGGKWIHAGKPVEAKQQDDGRFVWESPARLSQSVFAPMTGKVKMVHHGTSLPETGNVSHPAPGRRNASRARSEAAKPPE